MKLDSASLSYIKLVVETAQMVGIDDLIIEPNKVRAMNEDKTVVMFQEENVPDMMFNSVGLNRIGVFLNRLEVAKTQDNFAVEVTTDDSGEFARSIKMSAKGFKVDYRCANPKTVGAPRKLVEEFVYSIELTPQAVYMLQKGQSAMSADQVSLINNDDGATFEFSDINSDKFSHTFTNRVSMIDGTNESFTYKYPIKVLLPLFKYDPEGSFEIGRRGMLKVVVNNLNIFVLPQV